MLINFQQGIVQAQPGFLVRNGSFIELVTTFGPVDVTLAHLDANYLLTEYNGYINGAPSLLLRWGPVNVGVNNWLYWDIDTLTGLRTFGITLLQPTYGPTPPVATQGQNWFDTVTLTMKVFLNGSWVTKIRCFAALVTDTAITGLGGSGNFVGTQAALPNRVEAGRIIFADTGRGILKNNQTFFTTADNFYVQGSNAGAIKFDAAVTVAQAQTVIPAYMCVKYSDFGQIIPATYSDIGDTALAVATENILTLEVGNVIFEGTVRNQLWDWTLAGVGAPLWVDGSGSFIATDPNISDPLTYPNPKPPVARVLEKDTISFQPVATLLSTTITPISGVQSVAVSGAQGLIVTGSPITTSGTINVALNPDLTNLSQQSLIGFVTRTAAGMYTERTFDSGTGIAIVNGDGVLANPIITNTGVTEITPGSGITVSGPSGNVIVSNAGVISLAAGLGISLSNTTGNITVNNTGLVNFTTTLSGLTATSLSGTVTLAGTLGIPSGGTGLTAGGTANQILATNNAGNALEYKTLTGAGNVTISHVGSVVTISGATTTPGGPTTAVQFNNSGVLGGSSNFTWNDTTRALTFSQPSTIVAGTTLTVASGVTPVLQVAANNTIQIGRGAGLTSGWIGVDGPTGNASVLAVGGTTGANTTIAAGNGTTSAGGNVTINSGSSPSAVGNINLNLGTGSVGGQVRVNINTTGTFNVTNGLSQALMVDGTGNVVVGNQTSNVTSATSGFLYTPLTAGTPTGVPTASYVGSVPIAIDTTGNKLWYYSAGWNSIGGGGAAAGTDTQVQFNQSGAFGANSSLTFDYTAAITNNYTLTIGDPTGTGTYNAAIRTPNISVTPGIASALRVQGGNSTFSGTTSRGGNVTIVGGNTSSASTVTGPVGIVSITGGSNSGAGQGGNVNVTGGSSDNSDFNSTPGGGDINIAGGNHTRRNTHRAGYVNIYGGINTTDFGGTQNGWINFFTTRSPYAQNVRVFALDPFGAYWVGSSPGTSGQVITSNGPNNIPSWQTPVTPATVPKYEEYLATAGQTVFRTTMITNSNSGGLGYLQVFLNGSLQREGFANDYRVTDLREITFTSGLVLNNVVVIYGFGG